MLPVTHITHYNTSLVTTSVLVNQNLKLRLAPNRQNSIQLCISIVSCCFRIQFRYGQHWAPVHPDIPIEGVMTEMLLDPGEVLTKLNASSYGITDSIDFTSNLRLHPRIGRHDANVYNRFVPLDDLLYFSGSAGLWRGIRVTQIAAHRATCGTATPWISDCC